MDFEPEVKKYFKQLGYVAEKIAESNQESPDFVVFDDSMTFIVELKTKFPSEAEIAQRRRLLDNGLFHNVHEQIIRKNTLSGIAQHAAEQLINYGEDQSLRIVFLLAVDHLAEARYHQFEASLYGSTTIMDSSEQRSRPCFFFYDSDFFRLRTILDAAIVSTESKRSLLLNPYSSKCEQIEQSTLCERFDGSIVDPIKLEREGKAYIVLGDTDRRDEIAVLEYLKEKYQSKTLIKTDMSFLSGTVQFPPTTE